MWKCISLERADLPSTFFTCLTFSQDLVLKYPVPPTKGTLLHSRALIHGMKTSHWWLWRSAHTRELVPATSRRYKSHRVNWPAFLQNLAAGTNFGPCELGSPGDKYDKSLWREGNPRLLKFIKLTVWDSLPSMGTYYYPNGFGPPFWVG